MRIVVRLFAMQRERLGRSRLEIEVPPGADVAEAWRHLVAAHPVLAPGSEALRFARNGVYAQADERLDDSDELAVIPPVAGGAGATASMPRLRLTAEPIGDADVASLVDALPTGADGAVVTFIGRTRETPGTPAPGQEEEARRHHGQRVLALEYEAFESMALRVFEEIAAEVEERFGVRRLAILHRVGNVPLGEASVLVAAAAPHRDAAFEACRYAIDELKARAPIWKSERFSDGSVWVGAAARTAADGGGESG